MTGRMKLAAVLLALCAGSAHAQLYKWTGPDGKVTYSDAPPPSSAKQVETKNLSVGGVNTADFPFELAQAAKASPVTLYTTSNCSACDDGRRLLAARGIPFSEKTVNSNEDLAQFQKAGGEGQRLPLLAVGRARERGFEAGAWNSALTAAGYPETSMLPKNYRAPQAEPAAPAPKAVSARNNAPGKKAEPQPATELPPATGNAPPGFRF